MRLGLITTDSDFLGYIDYDLQPLAEAIRETGTTVDTPNWHDTAVDWKDYDLLIMRSPWDYTVRYAEFSQWLQNTSRIARILNAPDLITWNMDKRYLAELQANGIACIDTTYCTSLDQVANALANQTGSRIVMKPTVSAGSQDTGLFDTDDLRAMILAKKILTNGKTVMVQPELTSITTNGEHALFFFNMQYSYAFHKGPLLTPGGGLVGGTYNETISVATPSADEIDLGEQAIAAVAKIARERDLSPDAQNPLYARVDIATGADENPRIVEVELFEPSLNVAVIPTAIPAFIEAVLARFP